MARGRFSRLLIALLLVGLPACLVAPVAPARADTLVLANGDKITGEIIEWSVTHVVIEHPQLGRIRLALDQLKLDTGKPPSPGLFGTHFMRGWSRRVDLGWNGKQGNSQSANVTAGLRLSYDDDWKRWSIDGRYFFDSSDGTTSDNNARIDIRRDWLIPDSHWFATLGGRFQFDQFEAWKVRTTFSVGPGYHLIDTERHSVDVRLSPAFTREFGDSQTSKAEGAFDLSWSWKISEKQSLQIGETFFLQAAPNPGDFRNFTKTQWSWSILQDPALSLNFGLENEFQSNPEPGDQQNNFKYFFTLGLDL